MHRNKLPKIIVEISYHPPNPPPVVITLQLRPGHYSSNVSANLLKSLMGHIFSKLRWCHYTLGFCGPQGFSTTIIACCSNHYSNEFLYSLIVHSKMPREPKTFFIRFLLEERMSSFKRSSCLWTSPGHKLKNKSQRLKFLLFRLVSQSPHSKK